MMTNAYACYNTSQLNREASSSGGIYILLAEYILKNGGKVYAVVYDDVLETKHIEITSKEQLLASQGSKYVASKLDDSFKKIKINLEKDIRVMFVGTPCQCYGLLAFLGKSYGNLLTVDFVCHGVPSRTAWRKYISDLEKEGTFESGKKLISINMRDKSSGWCRGKYSWHFGFSDGTDEYVPQKNISYMKGFISDLYLRPSCYECRFKGVERQTDITLGDYWGVWDIQPDMDDDKGTSFLLIHTEKGQKLLDAISGDLEIKEAMLGKAVERNPSIITSATMTDRREDFFRRIYAGENFDDVIKVCTDDESKSVIDRVKGKMKRTLNNFKSRWGGVICTDYYSSGISSHEVAA